jgi:hypothetical protein
MTDIHTGWTESRALLGKSEIAVQEALDEIQRGLPSPLAPEAVVRCQLTRGRPYKKDDNAHIEQKNWTQAATTAARLHL